MSVTVYDREGKESGQVELPVSVFNVPVNEAVLHQAVLRHQANDRQGTHQTKTRSEVSGGGKKPYKQKGTGRARQGSTRAPQFRHGGAVFGPKPHSYHHDVPKKMRRLAIKSALSDKVANEQLIVINELALESPRTKDMLALLDSLPIDSRKVLMMLPQRDENIVLSTRNIPAAKVQHVSSINVVELLKHDWIIMPKQTVRWIELVFGEGLSAEEASQQIADQLEAEEQAESEDAGSEVNEDEEPEDVEDAQDEDEDQESETIAETDGEEE